VYLRIQDEVVVAGAKAQYSGVIQTIMKVAREDGVVKLWRGVTPVRYLIFLSFFVGANF